MLLLNTNLTIGHWLLGLLFVALALACVYKQVAVLKLSIQLSEQERRKRALVAGLYFYGFFIFVLMTMGVFLGASIYSLQCWITALAVSGFLLPVTLLGAFNAYMAYLRRDFWHNR